MTANELGGICGTNGTKEKSIQYFGENDCGKKHFEYMVAEVTLILR
jgi:hypothetical protein